MNRRGFILLVGSGAAIVPNLARAQVRRSIGFLHSGTESSYADGLRAFRQGLAEQGFSESTNLQIAYRWADGQHDRLPALAADLVRHGVECIAAAGGPVAALAAKQATSTLPVVFTAVSDPVRSGLVQSMNRPGGNATGNAGLTTELDAKRLEILAELTPGPFGILVNPTRPGVEAQIHDIQDAAQRLSVQTLVAPVATEDELDDAVSTMRDVKAILVSADPFFAGQMRKVVGVIARRKLPAIFQWREFVLEGGLISYGPSRIEAYRQTGLYTGRILRGEAPADLPVIQPAVFELIINSGTAKALALPIPPSLFARADEVIE